MNKSKSMFSYPSSDNQFLSQHVSLLCDSFYQYLGYPLIGDRTDSDDMQDSAKENKMVVNNGKIIGDCKEAKDFQSIAQEKKEQGKIAQAKIAQAKIAQAKKVFNAPFVLISHGTQTDPIFNYANLTALQLFGMQWEEFTQMPSKYSAESPNREERARLLAEVEEKGYIANYQGVRIAKSGQRFLIEQAIVWNVIDAQGQYRGQAAYFDRWKPL